MDINCIILIFAVVAVAFTLCLICGLFSALLNILNLRSIAKLFEVISCILGCSLILVGIIALIVFAFLFVASAFFLLLLF